MKLRHFKELDGVRAIAALMIMFFHFSQGLVTHNNRMLLAVQKYAKFGQTGVSLFFVLSGFLITRILLNTKHSTSYFLNFYTRRALRIFPLYYLSLIFFYFLIPIAESATVIPFNQQIWYWVYLQNIAITFNWKNVGPGHFWSLAVEEHFYLFWPFIIYLLDKKKIQWSIYLIIVLAFITRLDLVESHHEVFYFTLSRMDELALGAMLAILEIDGKLASANSNKFLLSFRFVIIPTLLLWVYTGGLGIAAIQVSKFILLSICYFSLIGLIITLHEKHWLKAALKSRLFTYTGKISYGLYVYHPICFYLVSKYSKTHSILLSFVLGFAASFSLAGLSYNLFESKFLSLKKKFDYKQQNQEPVRFRYQEPTYVQ